MLAACGGGDGVADRLERCSEQASPDGCLAHVYASAARDGEVAAALAALEDLARAGRIDDCHLEAHRLARAVYGVVGDVERTFLLGGPQCRLGYLHGAVEASGTDAHRPLREPRCGRFSREIERLSCAHGFGHAAMLSAHHDLRAAVATCGAATALDPDACVLGAMMENSLRHAGRRDFVAASARGCRAVERTPELARLCYDSIGIVAALSFAHDPRRANAACAQLEQPERRRHCREGAAAEIAEARRSA